MRGMECEALYHSNLIENMLKNIPLKDFDWYISQAEIIDESSDDGNLHPPSFMTGENLAGYLLNDLKDKLVIFINIKAYPKGKKPVSINVYEDFLKSSCEMVFLIADWSFVEVYVKNKGLLKTLTENARQADCKNILIKTDENDGRTRLSFQ